MDKGGAVKKRVTKHSRFPQEVQCKKEAKKGISKCNSGKQAKAHVNGKKMMQTDIY